jgi:hypothetical protein
MLYSNLHMAETVVFLAFRDASFEFSSYGVMLKFYISASIFFEKIASHFKSTHRVMRFKLTNMSVNFKKLCFFSSRLLTLNYFFEYSIYFEHMPYIT